MARNRKLRAGNNNNNNNALQTEFASDAGNTNACGTASSQRNNNSTNKR